MVGNAEYTDCISGQGQNSSNECPIYDIKQSDSEAPVMLELLGIWSGPLLSSFPGPLWPGVVVTDRVLFMAQIALNCVLMLNWIVNIRIVFMYKNGFSMR